MAAEFVVQGGSTSNDREDCIRIYQSKIAGEGFIDGDNNRRKILWEWYIILGGNYGIATSMQ